MSNEDHLSLRNAARQSAEEWNKGARDLVTRLTSDLAQAQAERDAARSWSKEEYRLGQVKEREKIAAMNGRDEALMKLASAEAERDRATLALRKLNEQMDKALAFKTFVHTRLDQMRVPKEFPDGEHSKEGCRVGDRLDWIADELHKHKRDAESQGEELDALIAAALGTTAKVTDRTEAAYRAINRMHADLAAAQKERKELIAECNLHFRTLHNAGWERVPGELGWKPPEVSVSKIKSAIDRLKVYADHHKTCARLDPRDPEPCDCGVEQAEWEIDQALLAWERSAPVAEKLRWPEGSADVSRAADQMVADMMAMAKEGCPSPQPIRRDAPPVTERVSPREAALQILLKARWGDLSTSLADAIAAAIKASKS